MENKIFENSYFIIRVENDHVKMIQRHGGVVIVPVYRKKLGILVHKRGDKDLIEFPRGFIEANESHIQGGERELLEELNLKSSSTYKLGDLSTDSGLIQDHTQAIVCEINDISTLSLKTSEGVIGFELYSPDEIIELVNSNSIVDNFTLSALAFILSKQHVK